MASLVSIPREALMLPTWAVLGSFGSVWGPAWDAFGQFWGLLGPSWCRLGPSRPSGDFLGLSWGSLGVLLVCGPSLAVLGLFWAVFRPSWSCSRPSWVLLGPSLDYFRLSVASPRASWTNLEPRVPGNLTYSNTQGRNHSRLLSDRGRRSASWPSL